MTTTTKTTKNAETTAELLEMGAELLKAEDRHGETKTGWWMDGVYLGPKSDPRHCLNVLRGN